MSTVGASGSTLARVDRWQQEHRATAITVASVKKFLADDSGNLAALLAFWAFFSIFPLMLAAATLLGWLLPSNVSNDVLHTIDGYVPLIDFSGRTISGRWCAARSSRWVYPAHRSSGSSICACLTSAASSTGSAAARSAAAA